MEDKLLNEINRFREISKLPLLTEQLGWLDNLIFLGTKRFSSLDDVISKLGYKNVDLTDNEIDIIADELKLAGLTTEMIITFKSVLKSNANLRKALTTSSDDFVSQLKAAVKTSKKSTSGFALVKAMDPSEVIAITKKVVTKFLNDPTSNLSKSLDNLDTTISDALQQIYDNGLMLNSVDEMYDIFDGIINKMLSEQGVDDVLGEQILQSFKNKYRTNSKTKQILDKFKLEGRSLNRPSRVGSVSKHDKTNLLPDNWLETKKWRGSDGNGNPILFKTVDTNIFNGLNIDGGFISAYRNLKKQIDVVDPATGKVNPNIKKYVDAIDKGVTMDTKDIYRDLDGLLGTNDIRQLEYRLETPLPIKKIGNVSSIFWTLYEPIRQRYRELVKSSSRYDSIISTISSKKRPSTTEEYLADFMEGLESVQLNFNGNLTEGQIKALKDKFVRLKSGGYTETYKKLWDDLNKFMNDNLDDVGRLEWNEIQKQLMAEDVSNWRWVTWKEIVDDVVLVKKFERKTEDLNPLNPLTFKRDIQLPTKLLTNAFNWIRENHGFLTNFVLTGNLKTPKQFKLELIKRGYARRIGKVWRFSAGGSNFVRQWLLKSIYIPLGFFLLETIYNGFINGETTTDWGEDEDSVLERIKDLIFGDFLPKKIDKDLEEASPEWYAFLSPYLDWSTDSPLLKILKTSAEGKLLDFKSREEKDLEALDEEIIKAQDKLKTKSPTTFKEKEMQFWKNMINETMLQRGLVSPQIAKSVTDNMSIKIGIDPNVVNGLRESVKTIHSDAKPTEKFKGVKDIMDNVEKTLSSGSVEHIVVTTPNGVFKLIDERGQIGIMFIKPDYETLMKNYGVKQTRHRLNELKF